MCHRLEKTNKGGLYPNRLTFCRGAVCCIGLFFVVAIGVTAGALAYYLPDLFSEDGRYKAIFGKLPNENVNKLSNDSCTNYNNLLATFEDKLVFKCGGPTNARDVCLPIELYCDGYYHCDDRSDEESCALFCSEAKQPNNGLRFSCPNSNRQTVESSFNFTSGPEYPECFNTKFFCDGWNDCQLEDKLFDETFPNCPIDTFTYAHPTGGVAQCSDDNGFLCGDGFFCTQGRCNGYPYCLDGSDEVGC